MKKIIVTLMVLPFVCSCVFTGFNGFGLGKVVKCKGPVESRAMEIEGEFSAIEMNGGFDVELVNADACAVDITANNDAFDWLQVYAREDGVLVIETKDHVTLMAEKCDITVSAPAYKSINVNGAVDLEYTYDGDGSEPLSIVVNGAGDMDLKKFAGPSLDVSVNGAADLDIKELCTKTLNVYINGAGDLKVTGNADDASFTVNGAGSIDASGLNLKNEPTISKQGLADVTLMK